MSASESTHLTQQDVGGQLLVVKQADSKAVAQRHIREGEHLVPYGSHIPAFSPGGLAGCPCIGVDSNLNIAIDGIEALQQVVGGHDVLALYHLQHSSQSVTDSQHSRAGPLS